MKLHLSASTTNQTWKLEMNWSSAEKKKDSLAKQNPTGWLHIYIELYNIEGFFHILTLK